LRRKKNNKNSCPKKHKKKDEPKSPHREGGRDGGRKKKTFLTLKKENRKYKSRVGRGKGQKKLVNEECGGSEGSTNNNGY